MRNQDNCQVKIAFTVISVVSSFSIALGLAVLSKGGSFSQYSSLLVGDVLSITRREIVYLAVIFALALENPGKHGKYNGKKVVFPEVFRNIPARSCRKEKKSVLKYRAGLCPCRWPCCRSTCWR